MSPSRSPERTGPHFSFWVAVAFTVNLKTYELKVTFGYYLMNRVSQVNYTMGTGFLTLPWAFYKAGVVLSVLIMLVVAVLSCISTYFILETMERGVTFRASKSQAKEMGISSSSFLADDRSLGVLYNEHDGDEDFGLKVNLY